MIRVKDLIEELHQFSEDHFVMVESAKDPDGFCSGRLIVDVIPRMIWPTNIPVVVLVPEDKVMDLI